MTGWSPSTSNDEWVRDVLAVHEKPPPQVSTATSRPEHRDPGAPAQQQRGQACAIEEPDSPEDHTRQIVATIPISLRHDTPHGSDLDLSPPPSEMITAFTGRGQIQSG